MRDYAEQVKALRYCGDCDRQGCAKECKYGKEHPLNFRCIGFLLADAADAIEELLQKTQQLTDTNVGKWRRLKDEPLKFKMNDCGCVCTDTILFGTEHKTVHLGYAIRTAANVETTDGHELLIMDKWCDQRGEQIEDVDRWCPLPEPPKGVE